MVTPDGHQHAGPHRFGTVPRRRPRGSWPAEEYAANQRAQGANAQGVMDLRTDQFLVVTNTTTQ
ncbi:hypothetical protein [Streptomyces sp. NPDC047841]|uniref:hypothetical protein n=1 Tax=Streptomyces sp. NPDC047841 TaxID=3154708 RepID=UPI003453535F